MSEFCPITDNELEAARVPAAAWPVPDDIRRNAARYEWLREHFRFANDSLRELWFDPVLEPNDSGVPVDLDAEIDRAMNGANSGIEPARPD